MSRRHLQVIPGVFQGGDGEIDLGGGVPVFLGARQIVLANALVERVEIDFAVALRQAEQTQGRFERTHAAHIALSGSADQPDVMYRLPAEVAPDGNSVDPTLEHQAFMENALRYQASLQLLDSRIKGIKNAIKGDS